MSAPAAGDRPRRLHLLRHAKSGWDDPALADEQRPLAPRGERAAAALARHLAATGFDVDLVLCSPARRTLDTWAVLRDALPRPPAVRIEPAVYEATVADLVDLVRAVDPAVHALLVVGHNPGLEGLARLLARSGAAEALDRLAEKYPTGTLATFTVERPWAELGRGAGYLTGFVRPRDLG